MTNLLENAHRHGSTSVIDLCIVCTQSWLTLEVGDRGPGLLSTKQAPGIIMASSDERTASEGLGLWIVEQLVSALGGTFSLQPREGGG